MMERGENYKTPGGATGIYVGTSRGGLIWVCYEPETFEMMCEAFDKLN